MALLAWHLGGVAVGLVARAIDRGEPLRNNAVLVSVVVRETIARTLFSVLRPFAWRRAAPRPAEFDAGPPVLLLHSAPWSPAATSLFEVFLRERGLQRVWARHLADGDAELTQRAEDVTALVAELRDATGADQIDIVAHGVAGLVVAWALRHHPDLVPQVRRLVTVGTPWNGTRMAVFLDPHAMVYAQTGALQLEGLVPPAVPTLSIWSPDDPYVVPATSGYAEALRSVAIDAAGHVGLLVSARAMRAVLTALTEPLPDTAAPPAPLVPDTP